MEELAIKIEGLKKQYQLGAIGGGTLAAELQTWWAKKRGKENPNLKIGEKEAKIGEKFWALDDINLEVKKGEAVGIIGHNGAGKSTLLKILSRVTAPTEGTVKMNGRIASMLEVGTGFHPELTGRENIYMNGAILGMSRREVDEKIEQIIDFSECRQFIDTPVKRYSSGMYVKLAFAVAAHLDAEIMIMDEVLAVGDVKFQQKCLGKMGDAATQDGKTVLYVSHNMNTIRQLCNRCIVLKQGKIIFDGDVEKAIEIYLDLNNNELPTIYDLSTAKRPTYDHGREFFVTELSFIDKKKAEYYNTELMRFRLKWNGERDFEDMQIMLTVLTRDEKVVGMAQSMKFDACKDMGEEGKVFDFCINNIVEGSYFFVLDVVYINEYGTHLAYDHPIARFNFDVIKDKTVPSITWQHKYWGNVRLNQICEEK